MEGDRAGRTLYVGGLDAVVTVKELTAAFIAFGEITDVQVPMEHTTQKNRGFGFVEFADASDAKDALENMNNSELFGRVLRVSVAKPNQGKGKAVWADAEDWYKGLVDGDEDATISGGASASAGAAASAAGGAGTA